MKSKGILLALVFFLTLRENLAAVVLQVDENEEVTTPYPDIDTEGDCITQHGDPGKCTTLQECYPLLKISSTGEESFPLEQEILQTSRSNLCQSTNDTTICCKINALQDSQDILYDENDDTITDAPQNATLFPTTNCGKSGVNLGAASSPLWNKKGQKITGGRNAIQGQFPWMVAIFGKNGKITCGASLLTNQLVLTAAHCLSTYTSQDLKHLKMHLGDYNIMSLRDGPHEVRRPSQAIVHKNFNSKNYHNDVALIKMDKPVHFTDNIHPICLPPSDFRNKDVEGKNVVVTGWGRDRVWGYDSSILRMVEMPMYKLADCHRIYAIFAPNKIMEGVNLCAGDARKSKDACIGDSGGPLQYLVDSRWTQLGITSWGKGCGSFPGVYTSLVNYLPWIEKQVARLKLS